MRDVGIRKYDHIDLLGADQQLHFFFVDDGNAVGIKRTGKFRWIPAAGNVGDLGGGKGDDLVVAVIAEQAVEIVKIAAGCAEYDNALHEPSWLTGESVGTQAEVP